MKATDLSCAPPDIFVALGVDKTPGGARWRARGLQSFGCCDDSRSARALGRQSESERVRVKRFGATIQTLPCAQDLRASLSLAFSAKLDMLFGLAKLIERARIFGFRFVKREHFAMFENND